MIPLQYHRHKFPMVSLRSFIVLRSLCFRKREIEIRCPGVPVRFPLPGGNQVDSFFAFFFIIESALKIFGKSGVWAI